MMAQTERSKQMFECAVEAGKRVAPTVFKEIKGHDVIVSTYRLWHRKAWVMASWGRMALILTKDGRLWLQRGGSAHQVKAPAEVLEKIFTVHKRELWWGGGVIGTIQACLKRHYPNTIFQLRTWNGKQKATIHVTWIGLPEPALVQKLVDSYRLPERTIVLKHV
jgi:hypothetical protein